VGHHSLLQMLSRCWVTPQQQRFNCAELIAEVASGSNAAVQNNRPSQACVTAARKGLRPRGAGGVTDVPFAATAVENRPASARDRSCDHDRRQRTERSIAMCVSGISER
jgi:hypothetical protein